MKGLPSLRIIFLSSDTSKIRKTIVKFQECCLPAFPRIYIVSSSLSANLVHQNIPPYVLFSAVLSYQVCCTTKDALLMLVACPQSS